MTPLSIRAMLHHIVDYAGLFPPARLDMQTTLNNYADYLESPEAWMLGRLIVPVARFDEFEQYAADVLPTDPAGDPWHISAITATAGSDEYKTDLKEISAFNQRHERAENGLAVVDSVELKAAAPRAIERALDDVPDEIFPFFEIPVAADPRGLIAALVGSLSGAKIRTGGETPEMIPAPEHVARFIMGCANAGVPFKATAGLHHPLRHHDRTVGVKTFGFFNIFMAAALAPLPDFDEPDLVEVLTEESIENFRFDDKMACWRGHKMDIEDIEECRAEFAISFGSCSFDEPREDLRRLGLM